MTNYRLYIFASLGLTDRSKFIYAYLIRHHRLSQGMSWGRHVGQ